MTVKITADAADISKRNSSKKNSFRVGVIEVGIHQSDVFPFPSAVWRQTRRRTETKKWEAKGNKKEAIFLGFLLLLWFT
jgi:hypothetical protein